MAMTIVPRQKAATSMDIFLLVTDNPNTRIWEVASPHRGLSFFGPMVWRENTRLTRVPAIQIDLVKIVLAIFCRDSGAARGSYVMSSVS
jgi:hypothetical protein